MCWALAITSAWAVVATVFGLSLGRAIKIADEKEGHRDV